ncbi:MAG: ApaG domain [Akkermansia sp.]|nr:ApaG domain [Akkermansia sp.]
MSTDGHSLPVLDVLDMGIALAGLRITRYPEPMYHVFFRIRLHNAGECSLRLKGRKWFLQDNTGDSRIIEAAQVFNQSPILTPGAVFSYSGNHSFNRPPVRMELRFFGEVQWGTPFISPALIFPRQCFRAPRL